MTPPQHASAPPDEAMPAHIETTVRSIAELHARHDKRTTVVQHLIAATTAFVGRPLFLGLLTAAVLLWAGGNLLVAALGGHPWDAPPFSWMTNTATLLALYTTVLILATQRHDDQLANHREQLTLELAILSEQKSAKIIELLEKIRRDSPHLANHVDEEAAAMATPSDTMAVLTALHDAHDAEEGAGNRAVQAS